MKAPRNVGLLLTGLIMVGAAQPMQAKWWNSDWTLRKKIVLDVTPKGTAIAQPINSPAILLRLHDGNFQFSAAKEDGSDLRFLADDDKTILSYHIEKFDTLLGEAFVWIKAPELKPGATTTISLYYANSGSTAIKAESAKGTYDSDTVLVYHFAEKGTPPTDSSAAGNNAEGASIAADGSMIGTGLRLDGRNVLTIPASPSLVWTDGGSMSWTAWLKPAALQPQAIVYSRREGPNSFLIGMDKGVPFVEVNGQRTGAGSPVTGESWHHIAVTSAGGKVLLYLDGEPYGSLDVNLPAMNSAASLGGSGSSDLSPGLEGFVGEMDELEIARLRGPLTS